MSGNNVSFYNFETKTFREKIEPAQFWLNEKTEKALEMFWNGIRGNEGILLLIGDVGTGKTAFVDKLISSFAEEITVVFVVNPGLNKFEFLKIVANAFHLKKSLGNRNEFLTHFKEFLVSNKLARSLFFILKKCSSKILILLFVKFLDIYAFLWVRNLNNG